MQNYLKKLTLALPVLLLSLTVNAHEVWLERDNNGPVRVYLGEPGQPESGEHIDTLKGAKLFAEDMANSVALSQKDDHWQGEVSSDGDVRLYSDSVWQPWEFNGPQWWQFWKSGSDQLQGGILEARAGRQETQAKLNFEIVPVAAGSETFVATFQGKPLAGQKVGVLSPSGQETEVMANDKGEFVLQAIEQGRYLLSSVHTVDGEATHSGKKVHSLMYITSLTFIN